MYKTNGIRIPMQFFADPDTDAGAGAGNNGDNGGETLSLEQVFSSFKPEDILGSEAMKQALGDYTQKAIILPCIIKNEPVIHFHIWLLWSLIFALFFTPYLFL